MAAFVIVDAKELREGRDAFGLAQVGASVGPLLLGAMRTRLGPNACASVCAKPRPTDRRGVGRGGRQHAYVGRSAVRCLGCGYAG